MKYKLITPIYLNLKPSLWVMGGYLLISSACVYGILFLPIPAWGCGIVMISVLLLFLHVIMRDALLLLSHSWVAVEVSAHGILTLTQQNQKKVTVKLKPSSVSSPYLTVLHFERLDRTLGWRDSLVITPLQIRSYDSFRHLRVWLNVGQTSQPK